MGWYRNPPRASVDSLTIAYRDGSGNWRSMHPDFVFFHEVGGEVKVSIVDPHGHHLDDATMKLQALAQFAERCGGAFHRIEAVTAFDNGTRFRYLDAQEPTSRAAMLAGKLPAMELYESAIAFDYQP